MPSWKRIAKRGRFAMGGLAIARVGQGTWLRFVWPVLIFLAILTVVGLTGALLLQ